MVLVAACPLAPLPLGVFALIEAASLGNKVIDVCSPREMAAVPISRGKPDEYEIAKVDGVPLLPLSQIESRFTKLDPNQQKTPQR